MSADRLAEIRARVDHEPCCPCPPGLLHYGNCVDCRNTGCAHAPYIESPAREDMSYLLAEVERLRAEVEARKASARIRERDVAMLVKQRDKAAAARDRAEAALARVRKVAGDLTDAANVELGAGDPHAAALLLAARTDLQNALKGDS